MKVIHICLWNQFPFEETSDVIDNLSEINEYFRENKIEGLEIGDQITFLEDSGVGQLEFGGTEFFPVPRDSDDIEILEASQSDDNLSMYSIEQLSRVLNNICHPEYKCESQRFYEYYSIHNSSDETFEQIGRLLKAGAVPDNLTKKVFEFEKKRALSVIENT
jgi:hypothetical protein